MKIKEIITESQLVSAAQILRYVKQVHPEGEFNIDHVITDHPYWQEADVPVSSLHIFDPEKDDIYDPYNRVQDTNLHHVDKLIPNIAAIMQKKPLVIDDKGYILDGNHRALAAEKAGLQTVPVWQPVKGQQGVAEGSGFDQEAGIGIDGKSFKFKIRDLVALADNYPVTKIDPQQFSKQLAGRDEDSTQSMARAEKADLQYPIIVVKRQNGQLWIADGTHRAHKAIMLKLPSINAKIIPIKDMAPFDVDQGVAEAFGSAMTPQALRTRMNKLMNDDQKYTVPTQRTNWQEGVWRFITSNQAAIFADKGDKGNGDYPAAPYAAWLLVQHMDAHPERQSQFYMKLSKAFPNHPKLQFLKDRSAVNAWILRNANNPEYYVNGKPLPDPTVNVRNPDLFKDASVKAKSREEALRNAEQAGNKLLVAAVKATNAQTQPSYTQQNESVEEAGGPDMSRRGFLGGLGALVASSGLPKVAAGALQQIFGITTPEHLVNMQYALKSRGTLLQLTSDELDKISNAIKGRPLDDWSGFRGTHKSVYGNPLIDQAYRKLTGEDMKAARVARILKDNNIDPMKFFESPSVKAVIEKIRQEWAAKWAQSGASDDPFKDPDNQPPKMDDKKALELEKKRDKAYKELKNRNSDKSTKGTAGGRMGPITLPLKPTHINSVATNAQAQPNYKQLNKE